MSKQKAKIINGFGSGLSKWKNGDIVTIKQVYKDTVIVEEFSGHLSKEEIVLINSTEIPKKYKKKPVEIEAIQFTGNNESDIKSFITTQYMEQGWNEVDGDFLYIYTLEGRMKADKNDYIIKGVQGEFYPCKADIFKETYEEVL